MKGQFSATWQGLNKVQISDQSLPNSPHHRLEATVCTELAQYMLDVVTDRDRADIQFPGDHASAAPEGEKLQDPSFLPRQLCGGDRPTRGREQFLGLLARQLAHANQDPLGQVLEFLAGIDISQQMNHQALSFGTGARTNDGNVNPLARSRRGPHFQVIRRDAGAVPADFQNRAIRHAYL